MLCRLPSFMVKTISSPARAVTDAGSIFPDERTSSCLAPPPDKNAAAALAAALAPNSILFDRKYVPTQAAIKSIQRDKALIVLDSMALVYNGWMEHNEQPREVGKRLDAEVFARGIARSRSAAADLVKRGKVRVNGKVVTKASASVFAADKLEADQGVSFVSRAGEKLAHALAEFKLDVSGLAAIDIGSSTGGFTDCLLQNGAAKV